VIWCGDREGLQICVRDRLADQLVKSEEADLSSRQFASPRVEGPQCFQRRPNVGHTDPLW
jgi:hypothetical protein